MVTDLDQPGLASDATSLTSDTGELKRDWAKGLFTIDAPCSQGVVGWLGEAGKIELSDCTIQITNPKAAVILSSLDGLPLSRSQRILVSAVARATGLKEKGRTIVLSEPVAGTITLRNQDHDLVLVPLAGDGSGKPPLAGVRQGKATTFPLPTDQGTHWFLVQPMR